MELKNEKLKKLITKSEINSGNLFFNPKIRIKY